LVSSMFELATAFAALFSAGSFLAHAVEAYQVTQPDIDQPAFQHEALSSIRMPAAQAKRQCSVARPSGTHRKSCAVTEKPGDPLTRAPRASDTLSRLGDWTITKNDAVITLHSDTGNLAVRCSDATMTYLATVKISDPRPTTARPEVKPAPYFKFSAWADSNEPADFTFLVSQASNAYAVLNMLSHDKKSSAQGGRQRSPAPNARGGQGSPRHSPLAGGAGSHCRARMLSTTSAEWTP
jgi:hypothetical protein